MWRWVLVVGIVSFIVGMLGWSNSTSGGPGTENVLFCVFLVAFVAILLTGLLDSVSNDENRSP